MRRPCTSRTSSPLKGWMSCDSSAIRRIQRSDLTVIFSRLQVSGYKFRVSSFEFKTRQDLEVKILTRKLETLNSKLETFYCGFILILPSVTFRESVAPPAPARPWTERGVKVVRSCGTSVG